MSTFPSATQVSSALFGIIVDTDKYFFTYFIQIILTDSPSKLKDLSDKGRHGDYVFHWQGNDNARKKCLVVSISAPHLHICLKQSLNL